MFSEVSKAQSLTWRTVAAMRKCGSGRKKMRDDAAASRSITLGEVVEQAS